MIEPHFSSPTPAHLGMFAAAGSATTRDRILLQVSTRRLGRTRDLLPELEAAGGLVLSGNGSAVKVGELREEGHDGVLLADPAMYINAFATADEPFHEPVKHDQPSLSGPLEDAVTLQLERGVSAVLTPTGYIRAEDSGALRAAARAVAALDDPRVIFVVPIDVAWLRDDCVSQLMAILAAVPGRKALMLGGQMDPLSRFKAAVSNVRRLVAEVPQVALMRADIAAFGAFAHGAQFAAFGMGSSQRHIVPPGQPVKSFNPDTPSVLFPELMHFLLGQTLAGRFANAVRVPSCACRTCAGQALDRFTSRDTELEAISHNVRILAGWSRSLVTVPSGADRAAWWQDQCTSAVGRYAVLNTEIRQPDAFKVPKQLARWAGSPSGQGAVVSVPVP